MELFNGVIRVSGVPYMILFMMAIITLGYLLGRISIKGISLGTAGVFIVALLFGALFYDNLTDVLKSEALVKNGLKVAENLVPLVLVLGNSCRLVAPHHLISLHAMDIR